MPCCRAGMLGDERAKTLLHVVSQRDAASGAIFATNGYNTDFAGRTAFYVADFADAPTSACADRRDFFGATGTLLYIMAFIFAGNGIKELQAAGWMPSTPLRFPLQVPLLGIYPTLETMAAQGVMLFAFVTTTFIMMRERQKVG